MVKKVVGVGAHEILTVDVTCQHCSTTLRYEVKKEPTRRCQMCDTDYPQEVFDGLGTLRKAFAKIHQDDAHTISFEIELKDG